MTLDERGSHLLPPDTPLHFATLLFEDNHLTLMAPLTAAKAVCPACCPRAHRIHSGDCRTWADLPWALMPVALRLRVRRFFCDTPLCERRTCTERVPRGAPLYARTTTRLRHRPAATGWALGGAAGARQLARHAIPTSRSPVRRRGRRLPPPASPPPPVVGIDDWAWRKGHRDGTLVIDVERGCPIDVLEDRWAEMVADWFKAHPEVQSVARARAEAYASGIRQGAPEATQVADRFHLLQHLAATLAEVFSAHHRDLAALHEATRPAPVRLAADAVAVPVAPPVARPQARQQMAQKRARRLATYEQVWALPPSGGGRRGRLRPTRAGRILLCEDCACCIPRESHPRATPRARAPGVMRW